MKSWIYSVVLLFSMSSFADCELKPILAESTKASLAIYTKVKEAIQVDDKLKKDLALTELSEPRDNVSLMYAADINNDGRNEYIFTAPGSGSGGFINIFVFEKSGGNFVYLGEPPKPKGFGDGPWYFGWHRDLSTHQIQFLVNGCGSTYMQFDFGPMHKMERYLWKNGQTEKVTIK